jgi:hypothetical protein
MGPKYVGVQLKRPSKENHQLKWGFPNNVLLIKGLTQILLGQPLFYD